MGFHGLTKYFSILFIIILPLFTKAKIEIIAFHNCENFFYPKNDSTTLDDEFTPSSGRHWTWDRFNKKKDDLAKLYIDIGKGNMPAIIGLCEVEGKQVLNSLCLDSPLRKGSYEYVHYDSKDIRGIDVALIYRKDKFKLVTSENIRIEENYIIDEPTRDILYVFGLLNKVPLHIFVIHAPSRRNRDKNKPLRKAIFEEIYHRAKKITDASEANIIIMGDFNDNPWDKSVVEGFRTKRINDNEPILTNLMTKNKNKTGSYVYSNDILSFDQFLVSKPLLERIETGDTISHVFIPLYMIDTNPKLSKPIPFSTYKSYKYQGGISDHYPIYFEIDTRKD